MGTGGDSAGARTGATPRAVAGSHVECRAGRGTACAVLVAVQRHELELMMQFLHDGTLASADRYLLHMPYFHGLVDVGAGR